MFHAMGVVELSAPGGEEGSGEGGKMGNQGEELGPSMICDPPKLAVLVPARWGPGPLSPSCPPYVPQTAPPITSHASCPHPNAPKILFIIIPQRVLRGQGGCVGHPSPHPT